MEGKMLTVGGYRLNVIDKGQGPAILMFHGFPNSWSLFKHQIPFLVDHGFRVIVPDLLGFGASDKPQEVEPYTLDNQVVMMKELLDQLGVDKAVIAGHDWGSALAWHFAGTTPERTIRLVAMSVGHTAQYFSTGEQQQKSWYMLVFLNKDVGEKVLLDNSIFAKVTPPSQLPFMQSEEMQECFAALAKPGAATAGLNWYRANVSAEKVVRGNVADTPVVQADTLMIWPTGDDQVCCEAQAKGSEAFVKGSFRYERIECDTHFCPWFAPDQVNKLMLDFLSPLL